MSIQWHEGLDRNATVDFGRANDWLECFGAELTAYDACYRKPTNDGWLFRVDSLVKKQPASAVIDVTIDYDADGDSEGWHDRSTVVSVTIRRLDEAS